MKGAAAKQQTSYVLPHQSGQDSQRSVLTEALLGDDIQLAGHNLWTWTVR